MMETEKYGELRDTLHAYFNDPSPITEKALRVLIYGEVGVTPGVDISVQFTCGYNHDGKLFTGRTDIDGTKIKDDPALIGDVLARVAICIDAHFREHHPGVYPVTESDAYYRAKRKSQEQGRKHPTSDEIVAELTTIRAEKQEA